MSLVALVTGSAQGIGRAIALKLAVDGFDVALNDIFTNKAQLSQLADEIRAKGQRALEVIADVSIENEVKDMVERTARELGGVDVMVANAGILILGTVIETSSEDWDRLYSINIRGAFLCYKYAAKQMVAQGRGGRILGACSVAGKKGVAQLSAYCSSKFALRGLTQSAASELGKHGITVNAYTPGAITTSMMDNLDLEVSKSTGGTAGDFRKILHAATAVGHDGSPEDVASLVAYLASKEARFITGQSIICDGGYFFD